MTVPDPNAQELDLLSLGGGEAGEFLVPQGRGISETRTLHGAVDFAVDFFWSQNTKEKSAKKIRRKIRRLESKNPPGVNPPPETPSQSPPPPHNPPPALGRATPSPEPSGLGLAAPVCLCRWLVRSTSACGGSHLVAQPVSGGLHSFLGAGAQRGANAALAGTGHGFSEMHALSIFGVKVWALNIEKKSAVRLCKTWQDNVLGKFQRSAPAQTKKRRQNKDKRRKQKIKGIIPPT